ncbi:FecCD family ABC transporter permease [Asaia lannensis]|uniref:Iron ABC transporter permease n=1 Tax=Asaia lannensis NBRC 102526 TaxID=1307926 RepID=A0ABT1CIM2_9PROT|nr:iron ABC transporter permease [Asaia lannensis]MCO6160717.1 iron ABC transporter permease [Asaia lannensis NBRC 102526]GBR01863.1 ferrichrome Fe3+-siderophore transporter permease protein FecCD [Asaia lannensis NBRC 102526]
MKIHRLPALPVLIMLCVALLGVSLLALACGATGFGFNPAHARDTAMARLIVLGIRLPRIVLAVLVGAGLGAAGAVMQGMFRNPLADPGLIGVSSGAALGATLMIVQGPVWFGLGVLAHWGIPAGGMAGACAMTMLLQGLSTRQGLLSTNRLVLAGVALGALASAGTGILLYRANDTALRDLTFWTMGSLSGARWQEISILAPLMFIALVVLVALSRPLNLLLAGEENAALMGCHVRRTKYLCLFAVTLAVGPAVSFSGVIGFVGVIVPHLVRLISGPDHRVLVPASALSGGILLVLSDTLARVVAPPSDMPVGIITAAIGAPVFLWLLLRLGDRDIA